MGKHIVTTAAGDGIGPEIMAATQWVLTEMGAPLVFEPVDLGLAAWVKGHTAGISPEAWDSMAHTKVLLKGPLQTPQGGGVKSVNVTLRKTLGLFANLRPCRALAPWVPSRHPEMDVVIVRENEEDLYAGIEHQQTDEVFQCLKIISRPGTERLVRYGFEWALRNGRRKVSCFTKDNIMKLTDGLFHKVFDEIGAEYPSLEREHLIVDIGAARLADRPERFDVIILPNLYGDILSDVAAEIAGSVGLAPSANLGSSGAMFEAIHGSAPDIAGKGVANPSGLLLSAVMMLVHLGEPEVARRLHAAWLTAVEDGVATPDMARGPVSRMVVGTTEFAQAVVERLGREPERLAVPDWSSVPIPGVRETTPTQKGLVGVDVFVDWGQRDPERLATAARSLGEGLMPLEMITNRGVKVWPGGHPETFCTDHWRLRYRALTGEVAHHDVLTLLFRFGLAGLDVVKMETLRTFDGRHGYSAGQGQ